VCTPDYRERRDRSRRYLQSVRPDHGIILRIRLRSESLFNRAGGHWQGAGRQGAWCADRRPACRCRRRGVGVTIVPPQVWSTLPCRSGSGSACVSRPINRTCHRPDQLPRWWFSGKLEIDHQCI